MSTVSPNQQTILVSFLVSCSLVMAAGGVAAANVETGIGSGSFCGSVATTSGGFKTGNFSDSDGFGSGGGNATASASENGGVGVSANATAVGSTSNHNVSNPFGVCAAARVTVDDLVISGPDGTVQTSVKARFTGSATAISEVGSSSNVSVFGSVSTPGGSINFPDGDNVGESIGSSGGTDGGLTIAGFNVTGSRQFSVRANSPFSISFLIRLKASAFAATGINGVLAAATGSGDFGSTLFFVVDQDIFELPEGYTVSSISAGIFDNRLPAAVPLPAALPFLAAGLGLIVSVRRSGRLLP